MSKKNILKLQRYVIALLDVEFTLIFFRNIIVSTCMYAYFTSLFSQTDRAFSFTLAGWLGGMCLIDDGLSRANLVQLSKDQAAAAAAASSSSSQAGAAKQKSRSSTVLVRSTRNISIAHYSFQSFLPSFLKYVFYVKIKEDVRS